MRLRDAAGWCGTVLVLALAAYGFDRYSHWRLERHLAAEAATTLAAIRHGESPWRWDLRRERDVVAGRAFGPAGTHFEADGLHVVATADARVQVGLAVRRPIDFAQFGRLVLDVTTAPLDVALVVRETLAADECRSSSTRVGDGRATIDLRTLAWRCAGSAHAMPRRAAMFRLELDLRDGQAIVLRSARLATSAPTPRQPPARVAPRRLPRGVGPGDLAELAAAWPEAHPLVELPDDRVERALVLRDALWHHAPSALPVAAGSADRVVAAARTRGWPPATTSPVPARVAAVLWLLLLAGLRLRPPRDPRLRAVLEIAAVLGGPLGYALVPGDALARGAVAAASLVFAASLARRGAPWRVAGRAAAWLLPALTVLVALVLVALLRDGTPPATRDEALPGYALRYLAWAAIQQWLVCAIVMDRAVALLGSGRRAVLATSILFALAHAPNPMLMQLTLAGGLAWTANWLRHRALLPNVLAHAACGILLANGLPRDWLRSAEIGVRYFF